MRFRADRAPVRFAEEKAWIKAGDNATVLLIGWRDSKVMYISPWVEKAATDDSAGRLTAGPDAGVSAGIFGE